MRILMVCSSGGHLIQLHNLKPWWERHDRMWVTFEKLDSKSLLAGERIAWAHHPTTRNLRSLVSNLPLASEVALYEEWQLDRLEVRPGITGLWQVSGRSQLSFDEYVRLDLFYVENWSIPYDLFILSKTIPLLVSARGAY